MVGSFLPHMILSGSLAGLHSAGSSAGLEHLRQPHSPDWKLVVIIWGISVFQTDSLPLADQTPFHKTQQLGPKKARTEGTRAVQDLAPELAQGHFRIVLLITKNCHKNSQIQQSGNRLHLLKGEAANSLRPFIIQHNGYAQGCQEN